jgi:hypothetical protein
MERQSEFAPPSVPLPLGQLVVHLRSHCLNADGLVVEHERRIGIGEVSTTSSMPTLVDFCDVRLGISVAIHHSADVPDASRLDLTVSVRNGRLNRFSAGFGVVVRDASYRDYIALPGAVYGGNRFAAAPEWHSRCVTNPSPEMVPIVSANTPRLSLLPGPSAIRQLSGDLATPAILLRHAASGYGLCLQSGQRGSFGNHGFFVEEAQDRSTTLLLITTPGVRPRPTGVGLPPPDPGASLAAGDQLSLSVRLQYEPCASVPDLFAMFKQTRHHFGVAATEHQISFSAAAETILRKYQEQNWVEKHGYYSVGMRESPSQDWQTSWVGGLNAVYALVVIGDTLTQERALRTFDYLVQTDASYPSGYLKSMAADGVWVDREEQGTHLVRYTGDALYFAIKTFLLLRARRSDPAVVKEEWQRMFRRAADALVATWRRCGQLGHRVDFDTGLVVFGGTTGAATAIAGLALASTFFGSPHYLATATAVAAHLRQFVEQGIFSGAPGDALHAPDSESAFGLLEAYQVLHDATGDSQWLHDARRVADHCFSWVVSYDYRFPPESTFGRLGMRTCGTVMANAQNKCAVPGICSLSGGSLLRLFRATRDVSYLRLLRDIAHAIPQYMSRSDRPIVDRRPGQPLPVLAPGWINERVNMGDWEVRGRPDHDIGVGEVFGGSTWSEVAMLLTHAEVPGVYGQPDTGLIVAADHVDVEWIDLKHMPRLRLANRRPWPAQVRVVCEPSTRQASPLPPTWNCFDHAQAVIVPGNEACDWPVTPFMDFDRGSPR